MSHMGVCLRAEEPEPTFHFWPSSRSGCCGRANLSFCHCATSISSYRALLALSSERAKRLLIRHCVPRGLQSVFQLLHRVTSIFSASAMRSISNSAFTSSTARSLLTLADRHPIDIYCARIHALSRQRCERCAQALRPFDARPALPEPGNRAVSPELRKIFSRACDCCWSSFAASRSFVISLRISSTSRSRPFRRQHPWRIRRSARAVSFP